MSEGDIIAAFSTVIAILAFFVALMSFLYNRERNKLKDAGNSACDKATNHVELKTVQRDLAEFKEEVKDSLKEFSTKIGNLAVDMATVKTEVASCSKLINSHFGQCK